MADTREEIVARLSELEAEIEAMSMSSATSWRSYDVQLREREVRKLRGQLRELNKVAVSVLVNGLTRTEGFNPWGTRADVDRAITNHERWAKSDDASAACAALANLSILYKLRATMAELDAETVEDCRPTKAQLPGASEIEAALIAMGAQ